jgi:rod shape-determining protein MreC
MIKYLKEYRFYIILFLFLLIPVINIDTATRAPRDYRLHDRVILAVTAPIQTAISWGLDQIVDGFQNYIYLWHTREDNLALLTENRKLLNLIASLRETKQENDRLRKLLDFEEKFRLETVPARVIAKDVSTEFRAIRINRGENSGLKKNMAVVTNEGIVGKILRASANSADVVTMLDPMSAVDVIDERSRARGVVEGMTDEVAAMRFVLRTDDIKEEDLLVSSGLGGIFPKGIPAGTVSKVSKKKYGITQEVEVRPSVDFSKLEEVMVIVRAESEPLVPRSEKSDKTEKSDKGKPAPKARELSGAAE